MHPRTPWLDTTAPTTQVPKQLSTHFYHSGNPQLLPANLLFDLLPEAGLGGSLSVDLERQDSLQCEHVFPVSPSSLQKLQPKAV